MTNVAFKMFGFLMLYQDLFVVEFSVAVPESWLRISQNHYMHNVFLKGKQWNKQLEVALNVLILSMSKNSALLP